MSQQVIAAIRQAILEKIPDAQAQVSGGEGHYVVDVVSSVFEGKGMLESHQLVYAALGPLMKGEGAPVHAIDRLRTTTP